MDATQTNDAIHGSNESSADIPEFEEDWDFDRVRNLLFDQDDKIAIKILFGRDCDELYDHYEEWSEAKEEEEHERKTEDAYNDGQLSSNTMMILQSKAKVRASSTQGLAAEFSLESGSPKLLHLHPGSWFVAFNEEDFENHL